MKNSHMFDAAGVCDRFQLDLSCLVDGELDERAAASALVHLEECDGCRAFLEETRRCASLHRDLADPTRLMARMAMLTGTQFGAQVRSIELVHRLATIFYQLGKAYVLTAIDPGFRTRVFERAVSIDAAQTRGRGFVDGVLQGSAQDGGAPPAGVDWNGARGWLNGRLQRIEQPLEKGQRLLDEAVSTDPSHEEARIYLAWLQARRGKRMAAARAFRELFQTCVSETNRGHAAVQLGLLHVEEGDHRAALACFRWVRQSGLERRDERFFVAGFNIAVQELAVGREDAALGSLRRLLDAHPARAEYLTELCAGSETLQRALEQQPRFADRLLTTCPELFAQAALAAEGAETGAKVPAAALEFESPVSEVDGEATSEGSMP